MLNVRNLDDQTYEQIVEAAEGRLPWLCPQWTNHNASDPGITILELMAWYKELQQYHLNQFTDALRLKLLKLTGAVPRPASPARCGLEIGPDRAPKPRLERLYTKEGIPFELEEAIPAERPAIARIDVVRGDQRADVSELLRERRITVQPFGDGDGPSRLRIGFSQLGEGDLRLWLDVDEPQDPPRNPFEPDCADPRTIRWICEGAEETELIRDDTHALSRSGCVCLSPVGGWPAGEDGLHWLSLTLEEPGCEEAVRLTGVSAGRYQALQQETWASAHLFRAEGQGEFALTLDDAQARDCTPAVFVRTERQWEQTDGWRSERRPDGLALWVDAAAAAQDGADNVMILCLDAIRAPELLFDAKGLPGETFFLRLEGRQVLTGRFSLLCNTLDRDGQVRPALWRCVDDFYCCGPRDRVFTYDAARETVTFGDGEHGALLQGGAGAVLAAELTVTFCAGGNIPGGQNLEFLDGAGSVLHAPAAGGAAPEQAAEVQARLLRELDHTRKCMCAADYEELARRTPGLRVALARAIPAWDPDEPTGVSRFPTVTVVAVPAGAGERPMPDERFLQAIQRQLDRVRPIGVMVKVCPPEYAAIDVSLTLRGGEEDLEEYLTRAFRDYLSGGRMGVGGTVTVGDLAALAQNAPGVLQVRSIALRTSSAGCFQNREGDIRLPRRGIPCLGRLTIERLAERLR